MANALKYALVTLLASASAFSTASAVVLLTPRAPELRAARAEAPIPVEVSSEFEGPGRAQIAKANDGHYWAEGEVDGHAVRFLVDTGATAVALTPADAEKLGIDVGALKYGYSVVTAGGQTRAAAVKLASVSVAGARLDNVDAVVIEKGLDTSLLGMTYLGRLSSFQATRQALFLQP